MKKNKLSSYFIFISFITFLTIFLSIVQKSYFSLKKPQNIVEKNALLKEISPNLDLFVISIIESKGKNTDDNFDFSIIRSSKNLNTNTMITPIASQAAEALTTP
ncbi:MAG: hypothetical protein PHO75_00410 [Candidatus Shapirobacteria bacterium]|jgi:hypothetical protein|nr:hypothetical protein [Candidatus Shapirobacteria bacterium]